jgi:hypothetical protein
MADVFICYRHVKPDEDLAAELGNYFTKHRVSHFIDTGLRIGQNWIEVVDRELRACQSLIVLLSSESIRSDMVRQEVRLAYQLNKRIFPVRVVLGQNGARVRGRQRTRSLSPPSSRRGERRRLQRGWKAARCAGGQLAPFVSARR